MANARRVNGVRARSWHNLNHAWRQRTPGLPALHQYREQQQRPWRLQWPYYQAVDPVAELAVAVALGVAAEGLQPGWHEQQRPRA